MDLNSNLHGNWTLENAKARLNQFFQKEKTSSEYKYSQVGPDHNRSGSERSTHTHVQTLAALNCFFGVTKPVRMKMLVQELASVA